MKNNLRGSPNGRAQKRNGPADGDPQARKSKCRKTNSDKRNSESI